MEKYLGVKLIEAEPMFVSQALGKGYKCGAWGKGISPEGCEVTYEDGYKSWSPKDVFEKAYRLIRDSIPSTKGCLLAPHEDRVVTEANELNNKIEKLNNFILTSPTFKSLVEENQTLLIQQVRGMQYYFGILVERIDKF